MDLFIANPAYLLGRNLNGNTSWGVTGFRVGEITAVNSAELSISNIDEVVLEGESVEVEFTVTATPANAEYVVSVKNALGEEQTVVALGDGKYKVTVSATGD